MGKAAKVSLPALAKKILQAHAEAKKAAVMMADKAIEAGEALLKAKEQIAHGEWLKWLKQNCPDIGERTIQIYMHLARHKERKASSFTSPPWARGCAAIAAII